MSQLFRKNVASRVSYGSSDVEDALDKINSVPIAGGPTDVGNVRIIRNADYVGGTPGFVNAGLRIDQTVGAGVTAFEWGIVGVMQNFANVGENVGIYGQGNMRAKGGTWGGCMEAIDMSYTDSTGKGGLIGLEVDCYFNGEDTTSTRMGLMVVAGDANKNRTGSAGLAGTSTYGILILPQTGGASCQFKNGVVVQSAIDTAFQTSANGATAFRNLGTVSVGFDTSQGVVTQAALKMGVGQNIAFDSDATNQFGNDGPGLTYAVSGLKKSRLNAEGGIELDDLKTVMSGKVLGGISTPTLSNNKPGTAAGVTTWLSLVRNGTQLWIPCFANS